MKIQAEKLKTILELMKPAVPKKAALPAITFIKLEAGKAVATDMETFIEANLPEAAEPILLPYSQMVDLVKYVPGYAMLNIEVKGVSLSITWDSGEATFLTMDASEFPRLRDIPPRAEAMVDGDILLATMKAVLPYASEDSTRPVLTGVAMVMGNPFEVAAGDGFRMAHKTLGISFPFEQKMILPRHSVAVMEHVFSKTPRTPPAQFDSLVKTLTAKRMIRMSVFTADVKGSDVIEKVRFDFGTSASLIINPVAGSPPDFIKLIPKGEPTFLSYIFAPQFEAAVKRVRAMCKEGEKSVRLEFDGSKVKVSGIGKDEARISAIVDTVNTQGAPIKVGIDYNFMVDYLSGKQGLISIARHGDDETSPLTFESDNSPLVIIMPMKINWDGTPAAPAATESPTAEAEEPAEDAGSGDEEEQPAAGESAEEEAAV